MLLESLTIPLIDQTVWMYEAILSIARIQNHGCPFAWDNQNQLWTT